MSWSIGDSSWGSGGSDAEREFQRKKTQIDREFDEAMAKGAAAADTTVSIILGLFLFLGIVVGGTTLYFCMKKRVTPGVVIRPPPSQGPSDSNIYPAAPGSNTYPAAPGSNTYPAPGSNAYPYPASASNTYPAPGSSMYPAPGSMV